MNSQNTKKLEEMMATAGFCPDGDLLEFGEIVVNECIRLVELDHHTTISNGNPHIKQAAATIIRKHFGFK